MPHARQQILGAIKTLLDGVSSPPWRAVHIAPDLPPTSALACVLVYSEGGAARDAGLNGLRRQERDMTVTVRLVMKALPNPADIPAALDLMASAAETAITQAALAGVVEDLTYTGDVPEYLPDAAGTVSLTLAWEMKYSTLEGRPDTLGTD